jgi:phospholipid/cholesterol/gamma-HCH transport system substrate-binding protein
MGTEQKGRTELLVGLFLFIGLAILGGLVLTFGRLGQGLKSPYELTVLFPNASGLTTGADVLLSGAKIGFVSAQPQLVGDSYRVAVKVKVQGDVRIPRKSKFMVGSSSLLGDKFVDVLPLDGLDAGDFWQPNEIIEGSRAGGFEELTVRGSAVMDEISLSLKQIQSLTSNLNQHLLNEASLQNLQQTFENLRDTTAAFKKASLSIDGVVSKADRVLSATENTAKTLDSAGKEIHKISKNAAEGKGALSVLVNDKETGENLRSLISNLRRSGILFYKDKPAPPASSEEKKDKSR